MSLDNPRHVAAVAPEIPPLRPPGRPGEPAEPPPPAPVPILPTWGEPDVRDRDDIVARTTGHPASDVAADLEAGRMLTAEEAMRYGLVDRLR